MRKLIVIFSLALTGCGMTPFVEVEHISHLSAGAPFNDKTEDALDHAKLGVRLRKGNFYTEAAIGYRLRDGGFYGPDDTFSFKTGYEWGNDE